MPASAALRASVPITSSASKPGMLKDRDAVGLKRAADVGNLLGEVRGHLGAVGLVAVVLDLLEGLRFQVELADVVIASAS